MVEYSNCWVIPEKDYIPFTWAVTHKPEFGVVIVPFGDTPFNELMTVRKEYPMGCAMRLEYSFAHWSI